MDERLAEALQPLCIDADTCEPYLRLAAPYQHIVVTPYRRSDAQALIGHLNDQKVVMNLEGPPYPYLAEHAEWWLEKVLSEHGRIIQNLQNGRQPDGLPVAVIRDISHVSIAEALMIGVCCIERHNYFNTEPAGARQTALMEENAARDPGDPLIMYTVGDWLASAYHRQGIMPAVLGALMQTWAIPRLGMKQVLACAFVGNRASIRVFEKNGFKHIGDVPDLVPMPESKGGGMRSVHVVEWRLDERK
ncbi:acyl-CoA N-acyltransferase [Auriculariales sp. MPI-PUGE-AT-0066]|nr:acyl-CoA N-acyltransferase [Auriculariales sp. MPI-PUGE-AT-0066]